MSWRNPRTTGISESVARSEAIHDSTASPQTAYIESMACLKHWNSVLTFLMPRLHSESTTVIGLRERNGAERRQRILEAARHLIATGGMAALSMRKLAKEAGLAVATLYNLFGVREEILQALIMDAIDQMDLVLDRDAPLDDPIERCRAIVTVSVRHMVENETIFRPMVIAAAQASPNAATTDGHSRGKVARRAAQMQTLAIQAAIDQGLLNNRLDPDQLGQQIYHGYEFASMQWGSGQLDAAGFEARALYGLDLALLAVASDSIRPDLEAHLRKLEKQIRS
jgi:AcrR family transcriptional regulator